uniref:E3 ubiquitin-protein ligase n=1 Tax=Haemonchus placei TaxID=6290 RepID=A0A0N4X5M0_HAEPC
LSFEHSFLHTLSHVSSSDLIRAKSKVVGDNPSDRSSVNSHLKSHFSLGPTRVTAHFLSNDFYDLLCRFTLRSSTSRLVLQSVRRVALLLLTLLYTVLKEFAVDSGTDPVEIEGLVSYEDQDRITMLKGSHRKRMSTNLKRYSHWFIRILLEVN